MRYLLLFVFGLFLSGTLLSQSAFEGKITYKISLTDTAYAELFKERIMTVYTNDTLMRIENFTDQLGWQYHIKHLILNKSYLLLNTPAGKYAIQTKHEQDTVPSPYTFKKKWGSKTIAGIKSKKLLVSHPSFETPMVFYYAKKYPSKLLEGFEHFPGLLTEYYIPTPDGIYKYEATSITSEPTNKDLYGVPSDYTRVTLEEFIYLMTSGEDRIIEN